MTELGNLIGRRFEVLKEIKFSECYSFLLLKDVFSKTDEILFPSKIRLNNSMVLHSTIMKDILLSHMISLTHLILDAS